MKLFDTIALTSDLPEHRLRRGQVGTEFKDLDGEAYSFAPVNAEAMMVLHHHPVEVAA